MSLATGQKVWWVPDSRSPQAHAYGEVIAVLGNSALVVSLDSKEVAKPALFIAESSLKTEAPKAPAELPAHGTIVEPEAPLGPDKTVVVLQQPAPTAEPPKPA
jgi:hypothetical protein